MSCCLDQTHCKNWTWQRDPWFTPSYQQSVKHETQITEMGDTSQKWMDPSKFPTSQAFWQCRTGSHLVSSFRQDGSATIYFYTFRMREKKKGTRCQYKKLQSWVLRRHRFVDKKLSYSGSPYGFSAISRWFLLIARLLVVLPVNALLLLRVGSNLFDQPSSIFREILSPAWLPTGRPMQCSPLLLWEPIAYVNLEIRSKGGIIILQGIDINYTLDLEQCG